MTQESELQHSTKVIPIETLRVQREKRAGEIKVRLREYFEPINPQDNPRSLTSIEKIDRCYSNGVEISVWAHLMMSGKIRRLTIITPEDTGQIYLDRAGRKRYRRSRFELGKEVSDQEYLLFGPKALAILDEIERSKRL